MEAKDFLLDIVYKNKTVRFKVVNPEAPLTVLMNNLRHAIGQDGKLIFDFPSIDSTGAPMEYFFGKEDPELHEMLADYNVKNGDMVHLIADPFPG